MARPMYCHPADVLRRFDPTLSVADLEDDAFIGNGDYQKVVARVEQAGEEFETATGHAFRETRVGSRGVPQTYEQHGVDRQTYRSGIKVFLDHRHVLPIDASEGDAVEVRTGRDNWRDITDREGQRWTANYVDGWLRVHTRFNSSVRWHKDLRENNFRITYRYGALGGDDARGGETALSEDAGESGALVVSEPARLPRRATVLVDNDEYVRYGGVDHETGELLDVSRGRRSTDPSSHDAGAVVHYCPMSVRGAVADYAAAELVRYDDFVDQIGQGDGVKPSSKIEDWEGSFEAAKAKHSEARSL